MDLQIEMRRASVEYEYEDIADYLFENYYAHYKGNDDVVVPTVDQVNQAIELHPDKFIVVRDAFDEICGIAVFVTLTDGTYDQLDQIDIRSVSNLAKLLQERGDNIHFLLLCATSAQVIMYGIRTIKEHLKPKTISWYSPDLSKFHSYKGA